MKIYVGNLSFETGERELEQAFAAYGKVESAAVVMDRETNQSRGFGFVEMSDADGQSAIKGLQGEELQGRALKVNEARPQNASGGGNRDRGARRY
jgi:RNA recognition motif-containing protein